MNEINSKDNPNIKLYRKLSSNKKYRKEYGMFTLEGLRLIEDAVSENAELHCVFITASAYAKHGEALDFLSDGLSGKTYIIPDNLGFSMSDTEETQGIFAICKALDNTVFSDKIVSGGKYILLHGIQDPGNMGTIIRTADAFGLNAVITVSCCDIYAPKVIRSTMGSIFRVPIYDTDINNAFECFKVHNIITYAAVAENEALSLKDCDFKKGCAVLIGNEGNGLPCDVVSLCDKKLTIQMSGSVNSLNAAMAAGVIMWELIK